MNKHSSFVVWSISGENRFLTLTPVVDHHDPVYRSPGANIIKLFTIIDALG
jgi:hypothetical protein